MRSKRQGGGDNGEPVNAKPAELRPLPQCTANVPMPPVKPPRGREHIEPPYPWPKPLARSYTPEEPSGPPTTPSPPLPSTPGPLRYTHAAARQREGMRLTQEETRALVHVELWTNEAIAYVDMDIPAVRRALDKLRRGLELYEAKGKG